MNTEIELSSTLPLQKRVDRLLHRRELLESERAAALARRLSFQRVLELAGPVTESLEVLSGQLFRNMIDLVEKSLTDAVQEVLEQPLKLKAETRFQNNATSVRFSIERDGNEEDVYRGQGGSVANILSVGLRMFAIRTLDPNLHRRFLVLDEQDCWLQPQLVPRLVNIVKQAGEALGFQVLMISHHDVGMFEKYADRIYTLEPTADGSVEAKIRDPAPTA